jgi:hypothetical protein
MAKRGRFEGAQGANGYSAHPHPTRSVLNCNFRLFQYSFSSPHPITKVIV